jgi:hypothetical protein
MALPGDAAIPSIAAARVIPAKKHVIDENLDEILASWATRQLWTLAEASRLLAGENPDQHRPQAIDYVGSGNRHPDIYLVGRAGRIYAKMKDAIDLERLPFKESRTNQLSTRRVEPRLCVLWASAHGLDIPEPLRVLLDTKQTKRADELSTKEKLTLYRLVLGLAIANYKYKVSDAKSSAPNSIAVDLQSVGLRKREASRLRETRAEGRQEETNIVLHFNPEPETQMSVACLYSRWDKSLVSFAAITDEPPPEIAAAGHDRVVITLKRENVSPWLNPGLLTSPSFMRSSMIASDPSSSIGKRRNPGLAKDSRC